MTMLTVGIDGAVARRFISIVVHVSCRCGLATFDSLNALVHGNVRSKQDEMINVAVFACRVRIVGHDSISETRLDETRAMFVLLAFVSPAIISRSCLQIDRPEKKMRHDPFEHTYVYQHVFDDDK
jgi:hypothetical protein